MLVDPSPILKYTPSPAAYIPVVEEANVQRPVIVVEALLYAISETENVSLFDMITGSPGAWALMFDDDVVLVSKRQPKVQPVKVLVETVNPVHLTISELNDPELIDNTMVGSSIVPSNVFPSLVVIDETFKVVCEWPSENDCANTVLYSDGLNGVTAPNTPGSGPCNISKNFSC